MKSLLLPLILLSTSSVYLTAHQIDESQQNWVKRYERQTKKVAPEEALINTDSEPDLANGFTNLYNGENLEGWVIRGGTCTFEPAGESIIGTCIPGSPSTFLSTEKEDYTDFIFTVEVKWEVEGNTGVMFRSQRRPGKKFETVYGLQCEIEESSKNRGWSGGIYGQSAGGWRYPLWLDAHKEARTAIDPDGWNRVTIMTVGTTVKTWVNGIPAAHWINEEYEQGFFGLQIHSGRKGVVHFRNIKVKELTSAEEDLFLSGDFSNWTNLNGGPIGKGWTIQDGVIYRGGLRPGDIITKKHYKDFDLSFDWKISEAGNSGIKYRARRALGPEYQILDDINHEDNKKASHRSASLYDLVAAPDSKTMKPVGEWNHGRILAQGNRLQHWLNGQKVVDIEVGSDEWVSIFPKSKYHEHETFGTWTGPILLQDHLDPVWYRNVRIKEL